MRHRKKTRADFDLWHGLIVKVVWQDVLYAEEIKESEMKTEPDIIFLSYGEIIGRTSRNLTLACTTGSERRDRTLRECVRVPMSLIQTITVLEEKEEVLYHETTKTI